MNELLPPTAVYHCTHRPNANLLRYLFLSVDVYFAELDALNTIGQLLKYRRDDSAWTAPRCPEVDENGLPRVNLSRDQHSETV
jgi:hypothetical protein